MAASVLFSAHVGLFQVAAIWGIAVTLAIHATRHLSCAHLNPAVSVPVSVSTLNAFGSEVSGTFILVMLIFALTDGCIAGRPDGALGPLFVGLAVMVLISVSHLCPRPDPIRPVIWDRASLPQWPAGARLLSPSRSTLF